MQREISSRGGLAKAELYRQPATDALGSDPLVIALDLSTVTGVKGLVAATLRGLTKLPLDARVATCINQLAATQRTVIAESDIERELAALDGNKPT